MGRGEGRRKPAHKLALIRVYFSNTRLLEAANFHWLKVLFLCSKWIAYTKLFQASRHAKIVWRSPKQVQWRWVLQILYFRWISWLKNWVPWILILRESKDRQSKNCMLDGMSLQCCQQDSARAEYLQAFQNSKMVSAVFLVIAPLNSIIEDQFTDLNSKGYRAATLSSLKPNNLKDLHVNIILGSAEEALSSEFTAKLKKSLLKATSVAMLYCYQQMPYTGNIDWQKAKI